MVRLSQICVSYKFVLVTKAENQNHMQVEAIYFTEQQDYKFTSGKHIAQHGWD